MTSRWFAEWTPEERAAYAERFNRLVAEGQDVDGEARFIDALASRGSRILDAGCGTGRVADALVRRGHVALGVDADPTLVEAGRRHHPHLPLAQLDLVDLSPEDGVFDLVVAVGNVMVYLEPGTEATVLARLAGVLRPGGRLVLGFATDRAYTVAGLDEHAAAVGLVLEHRFATWELDPFSDDSDFAVSVFRS